MIAQITYLNEFDNYGQRLQAYALQKYIKQEFGQDVYAMEYSKDRVGVSLDDGRRFHAFERDCMNLFWPDTSTGNALSSFDRVLVGGDQVMNVEWEMPRKVVMPLVNQRGTRSKNVFLYGAGISSNKKIDQDYLKWLGDQVRAYGFRERCGQVDHVWTIDPVFLLFGRWEEVATREYPGGCTLEYIVYHGKVSELLLESADGKVLYNRRDSKSALDPRDFVAMFRGASRVRTNSFHGLAFALMFGADRVEIPDPPDRRASELIKMLNVKMDGDVVTNKDEIRENIVKEVGRSRQYLEMCLAPVPEEYCAYSKDRALRDACTSGGACAEAAMVVYSMGGSVFGAAFSEDFKRVVPMETRSMGEYMSALRKSKYSFCPLPKMEDLKAALDRGRPVMYVGSPCHVRAVKRLLGKRHDNLICVDFRCRGYSSPRKLESAVRELESIGGKVAELDFRPQHKVGKVLAALSDGRLMEGADRMYRDFVFNSLPMCHRCPFAHGMLSVADMTLGDFWKNSGDAAGFGREFTPERGCNLVSVNTDAGRALWNAMKDRMVHMRVS